MTFMLLVLDTCYRLQGSMNALFHKLSIKSLLCSNLLYLCSAPAFLLGIKHNLARTLCRILGPHYWALTNWSGHYGGVLLADDGFCGEIKVQKKTASSTFELLICALSHGAGTFFPLGLVIF
jgi:hypothetical protein